MAERLRSGFATGSVGTNAGACGILSISRQVMLIPAVTMPVPLALMRD